MKYLLMRWIICWEPNLTNYSRYFDRSRLFDFATRALRSEVSTNASGNSSGGGLNRIPSKMGVAGGGLHLRVTKKLSDHC